MKCDLLSLTEKFLGVFRFFFIKIELIFLREKDAIIMKP